jgi:hypothetical protein
MQERARRVRRPFRPPTDAGPYRLPRDVHDRLATALAGYRNRDAAFELARFIARFWSVPGRVALPFPLDRRELADRADLGLTEDRVRGAIKTLEAVGFLDRALASGSLYKATEDGLRKKPILFVFGSEYAPAFLAANRRAAVARGGVPGARRPIPDDNARRPSTAFPVASGLKSPKSKSEAETPVLMGEVVKGIGLPPQPFVPDPKLEAALENLKRAIGKAGRD